MSPLDIFLIWLAVGFVLPVGFILFYEARLAARRRRIRRHARRRRGRVRDLHRVRLGE